MPSTGSSSAAAATTITFGQQMRRNKNPMAIFTYALKAPESKRQYPRRLKIFLDYLRREGSLEEQAEQFYSNAIENPQWAEDALMDFISYQKERSKKGEISVSTIPNYYRAAKLFCERNDIVLNWKKIARGLPRAGKAANDRAPTTEEIRKLIEYPDRRIKAIVYTMVSSGIRIGAWDYLKWKHVTPMFLESGNDEIIAAKLLVYAGDAEEYYTFLTPEAYGSLKEWMDFREYYGEKITGESWVMRDLWQTTNITYGANLGLATCPNRLKSSGIKRLLERALWEQGLRQPLLSGERRHAWKAAHGFRKYYKSRAEQTMRPINVEITMGHNIGISASYYRPTEREVLEDYLKAVDLLTIHEDKIQLERKIQEIKEKTEDSKKVIDSRLEQKDSEILEWKKKYLNDVKGLIQQMNSMKEFQKETQKELGEIKRRYWSHVNMSMRP